MQATVTNINTNRLLNCERKIDALTKSLSLLADRVNRLQGCLTDLQLSPRDKELISATQGLNKLVKNIDVTLAQAIANHLLELFESRLDDVRDECLHINHLSLKEQTKKEQEYKSTTQKKVTTMMRTSRQYTASIDKDKFEEKEIKLWNQVKKDDPKFFRVVRLLPYGDQVKNFSTDRLIMLKYYLDGYGTRKISTFTGFSERSVEYFIYDFFPYHLGIKGRKEINQWWKTKVNQVLGDK